MLVAHILIELSQQEVHPHFLIALKTFYSLSEEGDCLLWLLNFDIVVGKGSIGQCPYFLVGDLVEMDVGQNVVGLGDPPHGAVT